MYEIRIECSHCRTEMPESAISGCPSCGLAGRRIDIRGTACSQSIGGIQNHPGRVVAIDGAHALK